MGIRVVNSELLCTSAHFMLNLKLFAGRDRTTPSRSKREKTLQRIARKYCRCEVMQYRTMNMSWSRTRWQGGPLNCRALNFLCLFQLKTVTGTHRNRMKKQKMFHQNWLNPPRKRERNCSRNLLQWLLSCLRQNRYSVLYSSLGTFSLVWKRSGALYEAWMENLGFHIRFQPQISVDLMCMRDSELFLFRFQELVKKQVKFFIYALNCFSLLFVFSEFRIYMAFSREIRVKSLWRLCVDFICHYGRLSRRRNMSWWTYWLFMCLNVFWSSNTFRDVVRWKQSKIPQEPLLPDSCVRELSNITSDKIGNIWGSTEHGSSDIVSFRVLSFPTEL